MYICKMKEFNLSEKETLVSIGSVWIQRKDVKEFIKWVKEDLKNNISWGSVEYRLKAVELINKNIDKRAGKLK